MCFRSFDNVIGATRTRSVLRLGSHYRLHGPCSRGPVYTTREHDPYGRAVFKGVHRHLLTTRDHGPYLQAVNTGSVYQALDTLQSTLIRRFEVKATNHQGYRSHHMRISSPVYMIQPVVKPVVKPY